MKPELIKTIETALDKGLRVELRIRFETAG